MNVFEQHLSEIKESYDNSLFLGRLVWYSITGDTVIDHEEFCREISAIYQDTLGTLPPSLPPAVKRRDVFKRACTQAAMKNVPAPVTEAYSKSNYEVKPCGTDHTHVWRNLVREDVDTEGHSLGYTELAQFTFFEEDGGVIFNMFDAGNLDHANVTHIKDSVIGYYKNEAYNLTPYAIREFIRAILENTLYGIKVRPSGGVYFIHEQFSPTVDALETYVKKFGVTTGSDLHSLPLLDSSKQREMLRNAFEQESAGEVDKMMGEISEILKGDSTISMKRYQDFAETQEQLVKKVADYSDLLDTALELTGARLSMMDDLMFNLMAKVKV